MRVLRWGTVAVLAGTLLTACTQVPGAGPVEVGLADLQKAEQFVQSNADGPVDGATPEQIVRGFLLAASSSLDDYKVAREFLSAQYAKQWDPYAGVLISEGTKNYRAGEGTYGVLTLSLAAKVDAIGKLLPVKFGASTELSFEFVKQGEQWRIASAPDGIILDRSAFIETWSSHELHFLGPGDRLLAETRWFLSRTALPTEIVRALLAGPSPRLSRQVHSGFPPGVELVDKTVPVFDGSAQVNLSGDGLTNPRTQQQIMLQLQASLRNVQGVNRVALMVDGTPVRTEFESDPAAPLGMNSFRPAGIIADDFGVIVGSEVERLAGVSESIMQLPSKSVVLARSNNLAAVLRGDGLSLISGGETRLVDSRQGVLAPSVDDYAWVWSYSNRAPGVVQISRFKGEEYTLAAPWLEQWNVHDLRVSPGGSLLAALVDDGNDSCVLVGAIIRDNSGVPSAITDTADVEMWADGAAQDFDWVNATKFVTLTKFGGSGRITIGGPGVFSSSRGVVSGAVQLSGGGGEAQVRVLNDSGELFSPQGQGWQRVNTGIALLAKRG